ncbi:hypothetical protein JCM5353_005308 [Sporobolomyces roseus]
MDTFEGDIGIPSFIKPRTLSPPRRSSTLPSPNTSSQTPLTSSPLNSTTTTTRPIPQRSSSTRETIRPKQQDLTRRLSFPDAKLQSETLDKLNRWIIGFVLVDFDVDTGPNLDNQYPHFQLPPSVHHQLAFSSLPEGDLPPAVATEEGYCYSWRIPYPREEELKALDDKNGKGKQVLRLPESEPDQENDGGLYGYVWFSQEQNSSLRRNYSQRSLVLLTHHPHLPGLFSSVLQVLGPLHFLHAKQAGAKGGMVESACLNIAAWPDPTPGATLELPLLGTVLTFTLPLPYQAQYPSIPSAPSPSSSTPAAPPPPSTIRPLSIPATHPLTPLSFLLFSPQSASSTNQVGFTKLLLIWELLVLGESLLLFSSDPKTGSDLVAHFKNLIRPIPFKGDSKPYFHIHDPSFPLLCRPGSKPPPGLLLSSTNPLVLKNCSKTYPHILRLDRTPTSSSTPLTSPAISPMIGRPSSEYHSSSRASSSRSSSLASTSRQTLGIDTSFNTLGAGGSRSSSPISSIRSNRSPKLNPNLTTTANKISSNGNSMAGGEWWGLKSERKRHVKKDEEVWKEVEKKWDQGDYLGCDEVIYRHFANLTERLLSPLSRYLLSPSSSSPSSSAFLTSLKTHGTPLSLRSTNTFTVSFSQPGTNAIERFYAKFWETKGCRDWREMREGERRKAISLAKTRSSQTYVSTMQGRDGASPDLWRIFTSFLQARVLRSRYIPIS